MNIQIKKEETETELRDRLARAARRRARLERDHARRLLGVDAQPDLTKGQRRTLTEADALEARAGAAKGSAKRALVGKAHKMRREVEAVRGRTLAERQDEIRLAESAALDAAREGAAEADAVERKRGQVGHRLRLRDGLKLLHERGALTPRGSDGDLRTDQAARMTADRLLAVGLLYRDRHETAAAGLRSCLGQSDRVVVERNVWMEARAAQRRAALANRVRRLEAMVAGELSAEAVNVLRAVAGEGRTIDSLGGGGKRRARLTRLLVAALTVMSDRVKTGD